MELDVAADYSILNELKKNRGVCFSVRIAVLFKRLQILFSLLYTLYARFTIIKFVRSLKSLLFFFQFD